MLQKKLYYFIIFFSLYKLDNSQTFSPLIWWHQLYTVCAFGRV